MNFKGNVILFLICSVSALHFLMLLHLTLCASTSVCVCVSVRARLCAHALGDRVHLSAAGREKKAAFSHRKTRAIDLLSFVH